MTRKTESFGSSLDKLEHRRPWWFPGTESLLKKREKSAWIRLCGWRQDNPAWCVEWFLVWSAAVDFGWVPLGKRLCIKFPWSAILINISTLATSSVPKQPMKSVQPATGLEHFAEGSNCRAFGRKKIGVWAVLSEGDASHITRRRSSQPSTVATTRTGCWRVRDLARVSAK